ncbi:MAG: hypothetical protein LBB72_08515 [Spirochaetaceae bacterium]|jgi:hypothetical protein|nr:hypothetical protein [Spirochaetaceae bacterium]
MAGKKDPSIYDDRSTLGSSDELDEYGVWVKSESQDLSSSLPDMEEIPDITDLNADDTDLPDFSAFSSVEAGITGLPDDDFGLQGPDISGLPDDDFGVPDTSGLSDDDFGMPELDTSGLPGDDFGTPELDTSGLPGDDFAMPMADASGFPEDSSYDDGDDDEIFGQTGPLGGPDLEFVELEDDSQLPESPVSEFLEIDNSKTTQSKTAPKESFAEVSMDDFMDSPSSSGTAPKSIDFGNLDAKFSDDEPSPSGRGSNQGGVELSNQLLMKIADELSSIKKELSSLKQEFSIVRSEAKTEPAESKGGGFFDEEEDEKIALTGDELDNILHTANFTEESGSDEGLNEDLSLGEIGAPGALSDQEDIISESGEELYVEGPAVEEPAVSELADISLDDTDLMELDGALKVEDEIKNAVDSFDSSLDIDTELPDFDDISPDLNDLREMGVMPVTSPPEDTSYLEADPLAATPLVEEQDEPIDLYSAVIEEPDLSFHITENPVSEPELDNISIDIDMGDPEIPKGPEDFVFETEETMEIPTVGEGIIEEFVEEPIVFEQGPSAGDREISMSLKEELKIVLSYMDQLLESLPEEKIEEFAKSEYFETYKKLFEELGLA